MNPDDFELEHSVPPNPADLDGDVATREWPMPNTHPFTPKPAKPGLLGKIREALS